MVTIANIVKKHIIDHAFILEGLSRGIISHAGLAEELQPEIQKEIGKEVKISAIVMALRRFEENIEELDKKAEPKLSGEMNLKTNIIDINVVKTQSLLTKIKNLYAMVNFDRGDTLNIVLSNNEAAIVTNEKYEQKLLVFLKGEKIVTKEKNLIALTLSFVESEFLETPGVIFTISRKLAWENINIYEIVSTANELTFILHNRDSMRAYQVLHEWISS